MKEVYYVLWGLTALSLTLWGCGSEAALFGGNKNASSIPSQEEGPSLETELQDGILKQDSDEAEDSLSYVNEDDLTLDNVDDSDADVNVEGQDDALEIRGPKPGIERVIVKFRPGSAASERAALHRKNGLAVEDTIPQLQVHAVRIPPGKTVGDIIARYERHPLVEFVEAEEFFPTALIPNDPWYDREPTPLWHLPVISAPEAWDITTGSADITIAILDTGIQGDHEDLRSKVVPGWNVVSDNSVTSGFAGHGTLVAGQAGAASNNGIGVASPCWGCKLMPIVVSENGWTSSVYLAKGIIWAADHGARIANMSFEIEGLDVLFDAASYLHSRGGVVVQSAGNSGTFSSIADNPYILKVSGTDWNDDVWSQSVTGNNIDLSAPATDIGTTNSRGTYSFGTGTSASAPIVSGVGGLVLSVNPALTGEQIQDVLKLSADDLGPKGWDSGYGWGRVNAARAVQMARDFKSDRDTTPPTAEIVNPTAGEILSGTAPVVVEATDDGAVAQVDLYCNGEWLSSDTVPPHEFRVDTTRLPDGDHVFQAIAFDGAGNTGQSPPVEVVIDNSAACECPTDCSQPADYERPGDTCDDALDNDCDAMIDCDDPDCALDDKCAVVCGNGRCERGEDPCSCPQDCGFPPTVETDCTNGMDDNCDGLADGDDPDCIADPSCGNGVCEGDGEDCWTCPQDCACRGNGCKACCGDGVCAGPGESARSCPVDCVK